jgi:hypothetical protein
MSQENVELVRSRGQLPISDRQLRRLLRYPGAIALVFRSSGPRAFAHVAPTKCRHQRSDDAPA